jgi:tetratricopeptide (TPR) repeat protein
MKAIKYYNEGYIDKSLDYCEKSISENIKNTSAINLKGLLYYLKGEIESAQALWKMNFQVNKDVVSKKYLEDSKNDEDKKLVYLRAVNAIKELKIREALNLLNICSVSDFNSINVNNCIAICYMKLGEYDNALKYINLVLKIDRANKNAYQSKNELITLGVLKKEFNFKYISLGAGVLLIVIILAFTLKSINKVSVINDESGSKSTEQLSVALPANNESVEMKIETKTPQVEETFPAEELEAAISNAEYEKLNDLFFKWKDKELSINNKTLIAQAKDILSKNGVEHFYDSGRKSLASKNYKNAINYLNKSLSFGEGHYLNSHIIYLLAVCYKNTNDIESAIKYYEKYVSMYPAGDYVEAVLYDLALMHKNIDSKSAKSYAEKLSKLYPKSMYNNSIIQGILNK